MSSEPIQRTGSEVRSLAIDLYTLSGALHSAEKRLRDAAVKYERELTGLAHQEYEEARAIVQEHLAKVEAFLKRL